MLKRKNILFVFTGFLLITVIFSFISNPSEINYINQNNTEKPKFSSNLEGAENVLITKIVRAVNISQYNLMDFRDEITFKNLNNNPITSVFIGIPKEYSDYLVFMEGTGYGGNTLLTERSYMIMDPYEMIAVYFDSPLLPYQSTTIIFRHIYESLLSMQIESGETLTQRVYFTGYIFPLLPYKSEKVMRTVFDFPDSAEQLDVDDDWGSVVPDINIVIYDLEYIESELGDNYIEPFLENLNEYSYTYISLVDNSFVKLEAKEITREIFISPWGIIKVKEDITIENLGIIDYSTISLKLPLVAENVDISDDLGEILGTSITPVGKSKYKELSIDLSQNRVALMPNSTFKFELEYNLPFEKYVSLNWFQETIEIDILTSIFDYLARKQTIEIIIDGCYKIDSITDPPESIEESHATKIIKYRFNNVSPLERNLILFTFTIDLFDMLLRPIILILVFSSIMALYVILIKLRSKKFDETGIKKEFIPLNEIREFCSLYEEKNAFTLEIRQAEEDAKRKKISKKKYQNILTKNTSKIEEIQQEVIPFKKVIMETNETLNNIVKKLDILEAERISVKDGLNLLETRYKRGRLPSRAAFLKLSDDFMKRRKKIDRNINKFIQQLRSYLI